MARAIVDRIGEADVRPVEEITVSAGVAGFPQHSRERDSLIRLADRALYRAKEQGKNRVHLARGERSSTSRSRAGRPPGQWRGALRLGLDARPRRRRPRRVRGQPLRARVRARRTHQRATALTHDEVELARLAGRLHDLGKLAVPREILRKEGPLSAAERRVLERHTEIGSRMVESIGLAARPWVLHHHERWDGTGYPDRLHGEEIPLGARIIFVAGASTR